MQTQQSPSILDYDFDWEREVTCYCGGSRVVTRRDPSKDKYAVCSLGCWTRMIKEGNNEPGSLFREMS